MSLNQQALIKSGIIEKVRERNGNIYGNNIYFLRHTQIEALEDEALEIRALENEAHTNNSITDNKFTENNIIMCPEQAPDRSGILLPLVDKSEYDVPTSKIERWREWETVRDLLVALDVLPKDFLKDIYEAEKQRYPDAEKAALLENDSASEKARKIIFMLCPELLKVQSKKHL